LSVERKEVIAMGWWETASGGIIGDGPANVIDEAGACWDTPAEIPAAVRKAIVACYREDWGREPTEQELCELLEFCR